MTIDKLRKEDYNILVVNALNGTFPLALRKKFPRARILCAEYFSYFTDHLQKLGFEVLMYDEINDDMKFDVVVGNPPFQEMKEDGQRSDQASNLWTKFWAKTFTIGKSDGLAALITPTSWLSPSADFKNKNDYVLGKDRLWDAFDMYDSHANVVDVKNHFVGIGSTFGYVVVDKSKTTGLRFSDNVSTKLGFRAHGEYELVERELDNLENLDKHFSINQNNSFDLRVSIPLTRTLTADSIEILIGDVKPTSGSDKPELYLYVHVDTEEQSQTVKNRVIACLDILNKHCKYSGFMNIRVVKMIKYET